MIELRPVWCADDALIRQLLVLGPWIDDSGRRVDERTGDDWSPGSSLTLTRKVSLRVPPDELRRRMALPAQAVVGVAARWSCRATATAGVHRSGPQPVPLLEDITLQLDIPSTLARSIEVELCVIGGWTSRGRQRESLPEGGLVWSDGWSSSPTERSVVLEGAELRIPVQTVSFRERFTSGANALWSVEIDADVERGDLLANVATVLVNRDVLERDFPGPDKQGSAGLLPPIVHTAINSDLIRLLLTSLHESINDLDDWRAEAEGTVGSLLLGNLVGAFGSIAIAKQTFKDDPSGFSRTLSAWCAPTSWSVKR